MGTTHTDHHGEFPEVSGELTDAEIAALYGTKLAVAEAFFIADPGYLVDIVTSGSQAASRRSRRRS